MSVTTTTPVKAAVATAITYANGDLASAGLYISADITTTTAFAIQIWIQMIRRTGTAFTAGWPNLRIETSPLSSGNDLWVPGPIFTPAVGASIVNTTLNGAVSAGATSCVVTSATNIAIGDVIGLGHTTTPGNYEIVIVKSVSGTTVNFWEACTNAHDTGAQVTDQAETYSPLISLDCVPRVRCVADNTNSGQAVAYLAKYVLLTGLVNQ